MRLLLADENTLSFRDWAVPSMLAPALLVAGACTPPPPIPAPVPAAPTLAATAGVAPPAAVPAPPRALTLRRVDGVSLPVASWSEVAGAAGYEIEIAACPAAPCRFDAPVGGARVTTARFTLPRTGLPPGRLGLRVRACDAAARCGAWSEAAAATRRPTFDFNGDGFADIVVAPKLPPATARGTPVIPRAVIEDMRRLRVFDGGPDGPRAPRLLDAPDTRQCVPGVCCTVLGEALAAGDLDGDGFPDLVVSGTTFCPDAPDTLLVYRGSRDGLPKTPSQVIVGPAHAEYGQALAVGDLDGDGLADVLVGAPRDDVGGVRAGAVYVYRGSAEGLAPAPVRLVSPEARRDGGFGASVAVIGDTDGDGAVELAISDVQTDWQKDDAGAVYLFTGGKDPRPIAGPLRDGAGGRGARFGYALAGIDVNGDGLADLLVGAALEYNTVFGPPFDATYPAVSVFLGARGGLSRAPARHHALGRANWNRLAVAGDVNGDGFADFVVSRPFLQSANKAFYLGDVQLYLGGPGGAGEAPSATIPGGDAKRHTRGCKNVNGTIGFGERIAGVGDVNGDGFDDVAVICTGTDRTLVFTGSKGGLSETPSVELPVEGVMLGGTR